jgi:hypothetical protein
MVGVFARARKELDYYPQVSELRRLAGVQPKQLEGSEADEMWAWLLGEYIPEYGIDGRRKSIYLHSEEVRTHCSECGGTGFRMVKTEGPRGPVQKATACGCRETTSTDAPELPAKLRYALQQLGATVRDAMIRILDCEPEYQGILRKEYGAAYDRALEVERGGHLLEAVRAEPAQLNPEPTAAKQLSGEVAEPGEVEDMLRTVVTRKSMGEPIASDKEWDARRQLLKRQCEELKDRGIQ